ncbi:hypothetical protein DEJ50_10010 [Streptomyces venezuelae]|uniref:Uncharacterized protein n=2 Tax=Streptomyces venezuelae TaxID=54571 RepID=A0A5P2DGB8_STRVZ|nr:hypothetical protein DEJ50_10010 [Streptomyces venezuelae]
MPGQGAPQLRTLGDVRAALRAGYGLPGDKEDFERDLDRALERASETDFQAVAAVIIDYRGRIRLHSDPEYDLALQEAEQELLRLRNESGDH